ncbi:MAG TPA: sigma-54 dependent transcriptional regulator [Alphaproteobacteria bacterium]|nr:sigma-54-dependent Fis family transcriptional regulator [Micavibrio sp.]HQX28019.1 sigma-54 dependent transcriptional regulator [Alphaproteobacteria bacterium]
MRLMIIGQLEGYISQAGKIALQKGAKVVHCEDTEQAIGALLNGKGADLVMIDVKQKIGEFVERLKLERIHIPVIACGINNDARAAVKAIQQGAKEYIPLPPDSELIGALLAAVTEDNNTMIAGDAVMKDVVKLGDKIAPSEATVLITGESGTGKEVMSQYIHRKSKRGNGPFIAVNCAAIPENLLESELFGHEKGAFTGATARRIGKFEEATNGTLLLDEVSEMAPQLQAKLLRVLQEKEITRVGSNDAVKVDVRIIATSNRDLEAYVKSGGFREDLYFRLNVVNLRLPSLRERPTDLPVLAQFFADKYADANAVGRKKISAAATQKMKSYGWRGNIRELENTMHRAILVSMEDEIEADAIHIDTPGHLSVVPKEAAAKAESKPVQNSGAVESLIGRSVAAVERDLIINTLEHCLGNRTHAANILGISIRTLRNKLNQYKDEGVNIPASAAGE